MQRRHLRYVLLAPKFGTTPYEGREPPGHLTVDTSTQDSGLPCHALEHRQGNEHF